MLGIRFTGIGIECRSKKLQLFPDMNFYVLSYNQCYFSLTSTPTRLTLLSGVLSLCSIVVVVTSSAVSIISTGTSVIKF